jgi:mannose-1-phosphate guanylyltransferase
MATHVVILAGGAGTRFWPAGRRAKPKQLLPITSDKTMLAETLARCEPLASPENCWVVTNELQIDATRREASGLPAENLLAEPMMRNTAAAIGLAAVRIAKRDPEAVMVVMPADHAIRPPEVFLSTFRAAIERATEADVLLTVGIKPTGPATGYGYIEGGEQVAEIGEHAILKVKSFKEKPDAKTAGEFIESGRYFWNSGTFVWRVSTLLEAFLRHLPGHAAILERIARHDTLDPADYESFENVPIDIGVMERADNVEVVPATFEWDDVGSWLALDRLHERDGEGNVIRASFAGLDTRNCTIVGEKGHVIATLGVEDLIIVQTSDATLVCRKDRAEDVRKIVALLKETGREDVT